MAGTAAVFIIARMGSASANLGGDQVVLDVVSAAVVGGVSIYGGVGKPYAAVLGAIFITAISNATTLMGIEYSTVYVIKGTIIIFFVALDTARRRAGKVS
jgi:ribose transport system permease protein